MANLGSEEMCLLYIVNLRGTFGIDTPGGVTVTMDGVKIGVAPFKRTTFFMCQPGVHIVRVRKWWCKSAPIEVELDVSRPAILEVDIPKDGLLRRMAAVTLRPSRAIRLTLRYGFFTPI